MVTTTNGKSPASSEIVLKQKRRRVSTAEKLRFLKTVEAAGPGMRGAVFRREGIFSSQLFTWRQQLRHDYNTNHPHSSRGDLSPEEFARRCAKNTLQAAISGVPAD